MNALFADKMPFFKIISFVFWEKVRFTSVQESDVTDVKLRPWPWWRNGGQHDDETKKQNLDH